MPGLPPGVELSVRMLLKTQTFNHISAKNGYRLAILFSHHLHPFLAGLPCGVHPCQMPETSQDFQQVRQVSFF
jgi:hypothetical protein